MHTSLDVNRFMADAGHKHHDNRNTGHLSAQGFVVVWRTHSMECVFIRAGATASSPLPTPAPLPGSGDSTGHLPGSLHCASFPSLCLVGTNLVQQSLYILFPALPHRADLFSDEWHYWHTVWVSPSHRSSLLQSSKMPSGARIILSICTHFSRLLTHRQDFQAPEVGLPPKILH